MKIFSITQRFVYWLMVVGFLLVDSAHAERQTLHGHIPKALHELNLQSTGRLPASTNLYLAIGLPLRNRDALTTLLQQLYDPTSPNYRHYLAPAQFTEIFGPTEQDYQSLIAFAKANRLIVTSTHPNRLVLDVSGTVADIERALHVTMRTYRHPSEAREFYAPDTEPSLDLTVSVLQISGLDNYILPFPKHVRKSIPQASAKISNATGSGPSGGYLGNDFRKAYVPGTTLTGTGQNVALFELDGYYAVDITNYVNLAGLSFVPLVNVGSVTPSTNKRIDEVSLDIEMVVSMAPGLSNIYVYEGTSADSVLSKIASDNLAKQISCSWGWTPSPDLTADNIFAQMAAQGQSFFNASGDSDAFAPGTADRYAPATSTSIVQVGGTTLTTAGPGSNYVSETVWNWGGGTGSSGGISSYYAIPSYQQGLSMTNNHGSTTMRNVPDVALTADNVYVVANNGADNGIFGGTSCAAPLWAAFTALVNQQGAANGQSPVGFLNPTLYAIGKGSTYTACFNDIITGNNFNTKSPTNFSAVTGYDLCTGWGTPTGTNLINTLAPNICNVVSAGSALIYESFIPTNGVLDPGETVTINFAFQNIGTVTVTNLIATLLATNGVASPSSAQTYSTLYGDDLPVAQPFTFIVGGNCGDIVTATFQLQNGTTILGTNTFALLVGKLVTSVTFTENFDSVTAPALPAGWTTTASGAESNWVISTAVADTAPNAAHAPDPNAVGLTELVSPTIFISSTSARLTFRHSYDFENDVNSPPTAYDGGVLEIAIGNGSFNDILSAGGSFVTGGYNAWIASDDDNPLPAGRQVWSGNSAGFITTTVNLPTNAANQTIQLKWRCATDTGNYGGGSSENTYQGWYVDTIAITDNFTTCTVYPDLALTAASTPNLVVAGYQLAYTLTVTNNSTASASNVIVTNMLPFLATFLTASTSQGSATTNAANLVIANLGSLSANGSAAIQILAAIASTAANTLTNTATVSATETDPNTANNTSVTFTTVLADSVGDGIPDSWRAQYFGGDGTTTNAQSCASCDADGTGQNNLFKYTADLNPTNPASRLAIISITAITNDVELIWIGGSNAWQFVECRSNLTDTNFWSDIFTNTPPSAITNSFIHTGAVAATNLFYRIKVQR